MFAGAHIGCVFPSSAYFSVIAVPASTKNPFRTRIGVTDCREEQCDPDAASPSHSQSGGIFVSKPAALLLLSAQPDCHFFHGVGPVSAAFYLAHYGEPAVLIATFNPHHSPGAAQLTLPRYQIERRNVHLDLHLRAYRRTARSEDKHSV
jgi:hypothetical protein